MRMVERSVIFGFPHKVGIKVRNYFAAEGGEYMTYVLLPVVGWFLKTPTEDRAE